MKTDNPLRIFTQDQLESFDQFKLKRYKNDLLSPLKFKGKPTINVNGIEVNKKELQEIFFELESNFHIYQFILQNRSLKAFFENENLGFLKNDAAIQAVQEFSNGKEELDTKITEQLQIIIPKLVKSPNIKNHSKLKIINKFVTSYYPLLMDRIYSNTYQVIKNHLDFIEENFKIPFQGENYQEFHPKLRRHVNIEYYENFEYLPDSFEELAIKYCKWCNESIIKTALQVQNDITKFSRESLYTLKNAATIAAHKFDTKENNQIVYLIKRHFDKRANNYTKLTSGFLFLMAVIYVIRIGVSVLNYDSSSRKSPYPYTQQQLPEPEHVTKTKAEARKKLELQKQDLIDNPKRISKYNVLEYGGEKSPAINAKLIKQKEHDGYTELWFNVNVHPSKVSVFKYILPTEIGEKHSGKVWPIVMNFKHPQVKNSSLQHKVKFDFKKERKIYPQSYVFKKGNSGQALSISLKPFPIEKYPLNGVLSRMDSKSGEILYSSKFQIRFDEENKTYFVTLGSSKKKLTFTKEYVSQMDPKYAIEEYDKFAIAIKNTNLILNKKLEQGKEFPIRNVLAYTFEEFNKTRFQSRKLVSERAFLKYYITSAQDSTAYVELNGQYVNLKYFADSKTGVIKGLTMVNSSDSSEGMEIMTIFSKK